MLAQELTRPEKLEVLEDKMLEFPQVECSVIHHFGPGIYIREVHIPAGTLAIGHAQRFEHLNIMLKGSVAMVGDNGKLKILQAPLIFTGQPGRKFGYALEDTIWQNIYATDERDIDTLEAMYLDKSKTWASHDDVIKELRTALHDEDREDFTDLLLQLGISEELVKSQSENTSDQIPMPEGSAPKVTIRDSYIEGKGIFLSATAESGELLAPARIHNLRTPAGRYTNHAKNPNAEFIINGGDIYLVAKRRVMGCMAGEKGEEVTVDYRQALSLSRYMEVMT